MIFLSSSFFFNFHFKDFKNSLETSVSLGTAIQLMSVIRGWVLKIFGIWIYIFNHPVKFWKKTISVLVAWSVCRSLVCYLAHCTVYSSRCRKRLASTGCNACNAPLRLQPSAFSGLFARASSFVLDRERKDLFSDLWVMLLEG